MLVSRGTLRLVQCGGHSRLSRDVKKIAARYDAAHEWVLRHFLRSCTVDSFAVPNKVLLVRMVCCPLHERSFEAVYSLTCDGRYYFDGGYIAISSASLL